jgi:hypothetical protein
MLAPVAAGVLVAPGMTPFQGYGCDADAKPRVPLRCTLGYGITPLRGYDGLRRTNRPIRENRW